MKKAQTHVKVLHLNNEKLARTADELLKRAQRLHEQRFLLGIAGIPGSGKSTLAGKLFNQLERIKPGVTRLIPMDGFHYPNRELEKRGIREIKGKPRTVDSHAYVKMMKLALSSKHAFYFPIYDRTLHEPIWAETEGQHVHEEVKIILSEGNYLLLNQAPWTQLHKLFHRKWLVNCPVELARERLMKRHQIGGRSWSESCIHYAKVDYENTKLILGSSWPADEVIDCK